MKDKFLNLPTKISHFHPHSRLQILWLMTQLGLLSFSILPAVGVVLLSLSALGTWWKEYRRIIRQPLTWGFAILTVLLVIVSSFGYYRTEAYLGLGNLIPQFIFFTGISALIQTPGQLRRLSWILAITSVPIVIFGLVQLLLGWGSLGDVQSFLGLAIAPSGNPPGRMSANFMYANILAAYLTIVFILSLGLLLENWQLNKNKQKQISPSQIPNSQFLSIIAVVLGNALALILTNSRNGWGISIFATLAFAVYLGWRWLITLVSGISAIVLLSAFAPDPIRQPLRKIVPAFFWARLSDEMFPNRPIPMLRSTQWNFAWSLTQQRPLTGWGLRNFSPLYIHKYSTYQMPIWLGHPHNLFLMLTAEIGIPTTIFLCALVGWVMFQAFLLLRDWSDKIHSNNPLFAQAVETATTQTKSAFADWIIKGVLDSDLRTDILSDSDQNREVEPQKTRSQAQPGNDKLEAPPQLATGTITKSDKLIFFSYLLAFFGCTLFNTSDVTMFDLRVNALGWLVLAGIWGVICHKRAIEANSKETKIPF